VAYILCNYYGLATQSKPAWRLKMNEQEMDVDEYIELVFSIGVADTEEALKKLERLKRYPAC